MNVLEPGFDAELAGRLRALDPPLSVARRWRHSRNTVLYELADPAGGRHVAKAYVSKPAEFLVEEHRVLAELNAAWGQDGPVSAVRPTWLDTERGVLATALAPGDSFKSLLLARNRRGRGGVDAEGLREMVRAAAGALHRFHALYRDGAGSPERSRRYIDYHPVNLLYRPGAAGGWRVTLMDVPETRETAAVHLDVGTFCFELARIGLHPAHVARYRHRAVPALKEAFIDTYFAAWGRAPTPADREAVRAAELARGEAVRGWLRRFWEYRANPAVEGAKAAYFLPVLSAYFALLPPAAAYPGAAAASPE
jgi:hypothetical protein